MFKTFDELMCQKYQNELKPLLIQAIAALSVEKNYSDMTPSEIYEHVVNIAEELDEETKAFEEELRKQ